MVGHGESRWLVLRMLLLLVALLLPFVLSFLLVKASLAQLFRLIDSHDLARGAFGLATEAVLGFLQVKLL